MKCKVEDCNNKIKVISKKLCNMHYLRMWRYGRLGRYSKKYPKGYKHKSISSMHNKRFGGLRDEVLKRDEYKCVSCGMTNEEHIKKWKCNLTLDHIDGFGRNAKVPHNYMKNLQTLCFKCHGSIEAKRYWQKGV